MDQELCNVSNLRFKDVPVSMALLTLDHLQCGKALGSSSMWRISSRSSGQKSLVHHPMLECFPRNIWKRQVQTEVIFSTHPQLETITHANVGEESLLPCKSQKHIHYKDIQRLQNILTKPTSTTKTSGTMWLCDLSINWLQNPPLQQKRVWLWIFRANYLKHTLNISMSFWNIVTPREAIENKHCALLSARRSATTDPK